ncbi:MAG: hypothetical protein FJ297_18375 [Planctomycetes bacterium]|nr:hypothetical protein [Planctomycetota bacterium]
MPATNSDVRTRFEAVSLRDRRGAWSFTIAMVVGVAGFAAGMRAEPPPAPHADMVVRDWYFRESLNAIDDWEGILARDAEELPAAPADSATIAGFPVPENGETVVWPNPVPEPLWACGPDPEPVHVRLDGGAVIVRWGGEGDQGRESRVAVGEPVVGAKHLGGGGKSQWYHEYVRRFDGLLAFRPNSAPFAMRLPPTWNPRLGSNRADIEVRNVSNRPLRIAVRGAVHERRPDETTRERLPAGRGLGNAVDRRSVEPVAVELEPGATKSIPFGFSLRQPGGALVRLEVDCDGRTYRIDRLAHVEDVAAILGGIGRILSDASVGASDPSALELASMRASMDRLAADSASDVGAAWSGLFLAASALRDRLLLAQVDFNDLLFVKRKPYVSEQPFMDGHHCYNRPGGGIYRLSPVSPTGSVTPVVESLGLGIYRDVCLHWNGQSILFAFGNGKDRPRPLPGDQYPEATGEEHYDLYESIVDGTGLRRIRSDAFNDCEPFYLPNGQIGFTSDRAEHIVMCGSDIHVASLHVMEPDGTAVRQLGFNVFNEFNPSVLPDGRIIYNRWEYNERSVTSLHDLFTMHPDGSHPAPFYGNATIRPNVIMFPKAVPNSSKVMALFTGHHGQTHGPIGTIDVGRGVDGESPIRVLTPGVPVIGERIEDSRRGWFSEPWPLTETTYLCSYTPTVRPWHEASWAIYVGDHHGNLALVYRDATISCAEPMPLVAKPTPPALAPALSESDIATGEASLLMLDVYRGLTEVARGEARFLRVLEDVPRKGVPTGGVICTSGTQIYTVKRVLGIVPIEADGSAHFVVPANRNVYFQVLDANRREIQRMRSVVCLKPNEHRTCVGCHEPRTQSPPNGLALAALRPPDRPAPPAWGAGTVSFLRDVQPVVESKCAPCHTRDRGANRVILTDDLTDQFTIAYEELLPYLSVANAMRWDNPVDVYDQPPYTFGSNASPLVKLLAAGHHDVALTDDEWDRLTTWIDTNAVYYDRYETYYPNRHILTGDPDKSLRDVYGRRCAECHGKESDGRTGTWWRSLDRHDVKGSRMLTAPLSKAAGGSQSCAKVVFADTRDADYRTTFEALGAVAGRLRENPRADLRSLVEPPR